LLSEDSYLLEGLHNAEKHVGLCGICHI